MTTEIAQRRKPSLRPRRNQRQPIIIEGRIVNTIELGPPATTTLMRVAVATGGLAIAALGGTAGADLLDVTTPTAGPIALGVAAASLATAAAAWGIDYTRRHPGGPR